MKTKISKADWKYMYEKPDGDPDFNYERNAMIIKESIRKSEELRRIRQNIMKEHIADRASVIAQWATSLRGMGVKPIEEYLGKKITLQLVGDKIVRKLQMLRGFHEKYPNVMIP